MSSQFKKVWSVPGLLAVITVFGLMAALLGTGIWSVLSWLAMIIPLVSIIWKIRVAYSKS